MSAAGQDCYVAGVDTHLDTHTAAICDGGGKLLAERQVPATEAGYADLLAWARHLAGDHALAWAVAKVDHDEIDKINRLLLGASAGISFTIKFFGWSPPDKDNNKDYNKNGLKLNRF